MKKQASSARTSGPNTPESDSQRVVMHDVTVDVDRAGVKSTETVQVLSEAPDDAIRSVNRMSNESYEALQRV